VYFTIFHSNNTDFKADFKNIIELYLIKEKLLRLLNNSKRLIYKTERNQTGNPGHK